MANNRITKETFARALQELLEERPLTKISVKDITEQCELSRNAFYYHFKDKYELINWIFYDDMIRISVGIEDIEDLKEDFKRVIEGDDENGKS